MAKSEGYVSAQYLKEAAQILQKFKERTYELMELQSGQHILDAGCGPGVDTIPLADYVGPQGSVTGVDIDSEMLDKANQAADGGYIYNMPTTAFHHGGQHSSIGVHRSGIIQLHLFVIGMDG